MGRSNENQTKITRMQVNSVIVVEATKEHELKTTRDKSSQNKIGKPGDVILGGEVSIPLGMYKAERDESGKMVNVEFLGKVEKSDKKETVEER